MADDILDAPKGPAGGGKKSKLADWVKKNKTLAIIIAAGGGYFIWHELHTGEGSEGEYLEEGAAGNGEGPLLPNELSHEGVDEEIGNVREEINEVREENKEKEPTEYEALPAEIEYHEEPETVPNESGTLDEGPGAAPNVVEAPAEAPGGAGISIHGRNFPGATSSRIAGTGELPGGKKYIEYVISYPGKNEHWRYFTATGNWSLANNSAATPAAGTAKTKAAANGTATFNPAAATKAANAPAAAAKAGVVAGSVKVTKGGGVTAKSANTGKTIGVGAGHAVGTSSGGSSGGKATGSSSGGGQATNNQGGAPQNNAQHPNAVNTGNPCVNGGVGGHTPPAGYHLFCQGGWIWRAPN